MANFEVRVKAAVAKTGRGKRRRAGHVFSRQPIFFRRVPAEVREDPYLEVRRLAKLPDGAVLIDAGVSPPASQSEAKAKAEAKAKDEAKAKAEAKAKDEAKAKAEAKAKDEAEAEAARG